jgi:hypothetical protein
MVAVADAFVWEILPCPGYSAKPEMWSFLTPWRLSRVTAHSQTDHYRFYNYPANTMEAFDAEIANSSRELVSYLTIRLG